MKLQKDLISQPTSSCTTREAEQLRGRHQSGGENRPQNGDRAFFVKYHQYGKAMGIAITDADFYGINETENYYLVTVGKLFELIGQPGTDDKLQKRQFVSKDGLFTKGYVLKKSDVIELATDIT